MHEKTAIPLDDRGLIGVIGGGARSFLQGLISNDIEKVGPTRAVYTSLLTPQGKFLHDFFIAQLATDKEPDALVIECEAGRQADLERRLTLYKLRADVSFADLTERYRVTALIGKEALTAVGLGDETGTSTSFDGGIIFADPRLAVMGARAILPRGGGEAALNEAGFTSGDRTAYEHLRLEHGLPDGSRDIIVEKFFPLECGLEELNAIDYDKGCYVGQELTARTHHRGIIKKRLMRVNAEGPLPEPGTPILADGKKVGEIRTGRDGKAIAMIRLEYMEEEAGGALSAGEAKITPVKPAWANF
jgi:folate-binding protein YgfZ